MASVTKIALTNEVSIPQIGLGTYEIAHEEIDSVIKTAIDLGYRHLDCALLYTNEEQIGKALQDIYKDGKITRSDLFITSKLWNTYHRKDLVIRGVQTALDDLQCDYLDLYLLHSPMAYKEDTTKFYDIEKAFPRDENGKIIFSDVDYLETYKAMEDLVDQGKVRTIGVSNFNSVQLHRVLENCRIRPANMQIESHPYFPNSELIEFCQNRAIPVTVYCPLGRPGTGSELDSLNDTVITSLADKHGVTPAQIVLRWHVQRNVIVVPKSCNPARLENNINIYNFQLTKEDMQQIDGLARPDNSRCCPFNAVVKHKYYPFHEKF